MYRKRCRRGGLQVSGDLHTSAAVHPKILPTSYIGKALFQLSQKIISNGNGVRLGS